MKCSDLQFWPHSCVYVRFQSVSVSNLVSRSVFLGIASSKAVSAAEPRRCDVSCSGGEARMLSGAYYVQFKTLYWKRTKN